MHRWIFFFFVLFGATLVQAQSTKNTITIGTIQYNPPFEVASGNNGYFGFDIDIMRSVCTHAHLSCQFKTFLFRDLFNQLETGAIDLGIASVITSKDRQQSFLFSYPYLPSSAQFFTGKAGGINSLADMKGKIIDTVDDPLLIQYLFDNFAKSSTIKSEFYQNIELALDDLQNGKINVFFLDKKSADYWVSNNNQQFKFIGQEIPIGFGYAIVGGAGNQALINVVNNALTTMENDGSYITIYTTYFGSKMVSGKTMPAAR